MAIQLINDRSGIPDNIQGTVATIGVYDGVHLGHCQLLSQLREKSEELGLATAVITFDRHPTRVTSPENESIVPITSTGFVLPIFLVLIL